jgi:hypothetical protein
MKKVTRNLLIIALALILVGGILSSAGFALGGMKTVNLTPQGPVVESFEGDGIVVVDERWNKLTALDIDSSILNLKMVEGDDFSLKGSYDSRLMTLDITEANGVLTIRDIRHGDWNVLNFDLGFLNDSRKTRGLTLTYPSGTKFGNVAVKSSLGNLEVQGLKADTLDVRLNLGNFTGRDIMTKSFAADLDMGNCEINGLEVSAEAYAAMDSGRLSLKNATINDLTAENNMGRFDFSGTLSGKADIELNMGSLDMDLDIAADDLAYSIDADMGSITLNGRNLGSSALSGPSSPTLTLDVRLNMGSADIRTK